MFEIITTTDELIAYLKGLKDTIDDIGTIEQKSEFHKLINKLWSEVLFSKSFTDFYGDVSKVDGNCVWVEEK